jgi:hypothetical protein
MNKQELELSTLNTIVTTKIAPSKIHGVGVFAIRDLEAGRRMYLDNVPTAYRLSEGNLSKLFPEVQALLVSKWPRLFIDSVVAYPDARYQAYVNHSDDPNYDCLHDRLIRAVKQGEEITEDYRSIPGWEKAFPWLLVVE